MTYQTIEVKSAAGTLTITLNRPEYRNSLNRELLGELREALLECSRDDDCKLVIIEGKGGVFCTGMDFSELSAQTEATGDAISPAYMDLLRTISLFPKIIVSRIDGEVMAGGVGIAAASDLVLATPRSQFALSEALWGLLPACVTPYLIRRVGFQVAYRMTLTTMPVNAEDARRVNLVDELTEDLDDAIRKLTLRISRLEGTTIGTIKQYFRQMWIVDETMETRAVNQTTRLINDPLVRENIRNFIEFKKFPWDKGR